VPESLESPESPESPEPTKWPEAPAAAVPAPVAASTDDQPPSAEPDADQQPAREDERPTTAGTPPAR
jgi:hypothetical protein